MAGLSEVHDTRWVVEGSIGFLFFFLFFLVYDVYDYGLRRIFDTVSSFLSTLTDWESFLLRLRYARLQSTHTYLL